MAETVKTKPPMSKTRRNYIIRLIGRCLTFLACILLYIFRPEEFDILEGAGFFSRFSVLHLLWAVWVMDMVFQLVPMKKHIPLGSQKLFKIRFRAIPEKVNAAALRQYVITTTKAAYKVFLLWVLLLAVLGILYYTKVISSAILFLVSAAFYVCDLICVLIWCPFRLMMKTRCCTTCRIFNWDHLMMFTPMMFIIGIYPLTLVALAFAVWILWELCVMMYPERFWEQSNLSLKCSECTDKLCTQYCQKLRK